MDACRCLDVRDFGAVGDGTSLNTQAIQAALDASYAQGGGTVSIAGGVYVAGTLYLRSNVALYVDVSATLMASPSIANYATDTHHNRYRNEPEMDRCFLYAQDATNIALTGQGVIHGNAEAFPNEGTRDRPMLIRLLRCAHVHLQGLHLLHAPAWTCAFLDSRWIWVRDVYIENHLRYNGDGLDFDGCSHVYVSGCHIDGTDDNLCLQASDPAFPTEDVHISGCSFTSICAAIRIGLKSVGDIRNVTIAQCTFHNVWREGIKIECSEGGSITDIVAQGLVMRNVSRPIFVLLNNRLGKNGLGNSLSVLSMPPVGQVARLLFSHIIATDDAEMANIHLRFGKDVMGEPRFCGIRLDAPQEHPIEDVTINQLYYTCLGGVGLAQIPTEYPPVYDLRLHPGVRSAENYWPDWSRTTFLDARNIHGLRLSDVRMQALHADERPAYLLEGCHVETEGVTVATVKEEQA